MHLNDSFLEKALDPQNDKTLMSNIGKFIFLNAMTL